MNQESPDEQDTCLNIRDSADSCHANFFNLRYSGRGKDSEFKKIEAHIGDFLAAQGIDDLKDSQNMKKLSDLVLQRKISKDILRVFSVDLFDESDLFGCYKRDNKDRPTKWSNAHGHNMKAFLQKSLTKKMRNDKRKGNRQDQSTKSSTNSSRSAVSVDTEHVGQIATPAQPPVHTQSVAYMDSMRARSVPWSLSQMTLKPIYHPSLQVPNPRPSFLVREVKEHNGDDGEEDLKWDKLVEVLKDEGPFDPLNGHKVWYSSECNRVFDEEILTDRNFGPFIKMCKGYALSKCQLLIARASDNRDLRKLSYAKTVA